MTNLDFEIEENETCNGIFYYPRFNHPNTELLSHFLARDIMLYPHEYLTAIRNAKNNLPGKIGFVGHSCQIKFFSNVTKIENIINGLPTGLCYEIKTDELYDLIIKWRDEVQKLSDSSNSDTYFTDTQIAN